MRTAKGLWRNGFDLVHSCIYQNSSMSWLCLGVTSSCLREQMFCVYSGELCVDYGVEYYYWAENSAFAKKTTKKYFRRKYTSFWEREKKNTCEFSSSIVLKVQIEGQISDKFLNTTPYLYS